MRELTTYERMRYMYAHQEADRIPVTDSPWGATIERWQREGMPAGVSTGAYQHLVQGRVSSFRHGRRARVFKASPWRFASAA